MKRKLRSWQDAATWRELLGRLIADQKERARLALAVRVRPTTLQRWVDGTNRPHLENLLALLQGISPEVYPLFLRLLLVEFPTLHEEQVPEKHIIGAIPAEFYARVLSNLALTPQPLCCQAMQDLILQQILAHLDPERHGLLASVAVCVSPRTDGRVRSLCERDGLGTPPWPRDLSERLFFLGSESLVGYAVKLMRTFVINSRDEMTILPVHWSEYERSAAAFPILRKARIAGGLLVASARDFFFTPERLAVIEAYSHLATCIFEEEEFYDPEQVELVMMPRYTQQLPYFAGYPRRVLQKVAEASQRRIWKRYYCAFSCKAKIQTSQSMCIERCRAADAGEGTPVEREGRDLGRAVTRPKSLPSLSTGVPSETTAQAPSYMYVVCDPEFSYSCNIF